MSKKIYILFAFAAVLILTGQSCLNTTAAGPMGIFKTIDKGETWLAKTSYPTVKGVQSLAGLKVFHIHTDPSDVNAIYLASRGQGLYYSYNNGEMWQSADFLAGKYIYGFVVDPNNKCVIYVSDGPHIYKTTDCMRSWNLAFTEERPSQRFVALAVDYGNSNNIYGAEVGGDILQSQNGGGSWRVIKSFGLEIRQLIADPRKPSRLYAASYGNGLYRSDDGGANWVQASVGFDKFSDSNTFYRLVLNPTKDDSIFWISKYGILRSDDIGNTWTDIKLLTPPGSVNIYTFAVNPQNQNEMYYTGTILNEKNQNVRSTMYRSIDGGNNWVTRKLPTNSIPTDIYMTPSGKDLFLGFTVL